MHLNNFMYYLWFFYLYKHTYIFIYIHIYIYICICMYVYIYLYIFICLYIYSYIYTYLKVYIFIYSISQDFCTRTSGGGSQNVQSSTIIASFDIPVLFQNCDFSSSVPSFHHIDRILVLSRSMFKCLRT